MNHAELSQFWQTHRLSIYSRCYKLLRDQAAAEDATQETFLRLQRHITRVPPRDDEAFAWISRIATNYCLNEIRNRGRRPELRGEFPECRLNIQACSSRLDHTKEALADRQFVRRLIKHTPKLSSVAWLYHVYGMDQQEVADALGISRRTVVTRLAQFTESSRRLLRR